MIYRSDLPDVEIGGQTVPSLIAAAGSLDPRRTALVARSSGATVTAAELAHRVDRIGAAVSARGLGAGDVAAIWAPNMPPWAGIALGVMTAGCAVTGCNPAASDEEVARQVADSRARMLFTIPSLAERAVALAHRGGVDEVVVIDEVAVGGATSIFALLETTAPSSDPSAVSEDAVALVPYSSGTSGLPKGVMLSHRNLVTSLRQLGATLQLCPNDTTLAVAPFFHAMGFVLSLLAPLAAGATVVTAPRFEPDDFVRTLSEHRVTFLAAPPPVAHVLAVHPDVERHHLALELVAFGGAPLAVETQAAVARRLPNAVVGQGWGMTETTVAVTTPRRDEAARPGSVGRLVPNTELRVFDPERGRDVPGGERGELWVRGPQVMVGYRDHPEETAAIVDAGGWLHTGDLGHVDEDGWVFVVDRLKELIKVNGYQVAPAELEALLVQHDGVADAAVVGRPDPGRGEVPIAFVVPRGALDTDELSRWVAQRVTPYKRLGRVHLVDALPRTPSGKLLRRRLDEASQCAEGKVSG